MLNINIFYIQTDVLLHLCIMNLNNIKLIYKLLLSTFT